MVDANHDADVVTFAPGAVIVVEVACTRTRWPLWGLP